MKSENLLNQKNRELYCSLCKIYSWSNKIESICDQCGNLLITVLYDILTKQRITGKDQENT